MNINNLLSGGPAPAPSKPPPPPQPQPQPQSQHAQQQTHHQVHQNQQQSLPSTPVQSIPPQSFRDYGHHPQPSPTRGLSQEYVAHQMPQGPYGSPQAYHHQPPYAGRPAPPPLQPLSSSDIRSPGAGSIMAPGPSPYRPTPTSSISSASGGYPFPAPQQTPTSPAQRHQYPPTSAYPGRDGYPQPGGAMGGPGVPGPSPYAQGPQMPQTPPVGTPGGTHPYLQQRTSSAYSATPTSATNQQQYGPPFGSPISTTHPPPPYPEHARQQSQPPTPLGPPPRQTSVPQGYAQPPSPYQQRMSSSGSAYPPSLIHQISPRLHHPQVSPSAPAPPSISRVPSNHSIYDNPVRVESNRGSQSQSERDRSLSVSPKTRIPSLPSSSGQPGFSVPDLEARPNPMISMPTATSSLDSSRDMARSDRAVTPAKRKLEDRDLSRDELEKHDIRPPPFDTPNGYESKPDAMQLSRASASPVVQRRKRVRYSTRPVWAQRHVEGIRLNAGNFVLRKPAHNVGTQTNGKTDSFSRPEFASRHASPEEKRSIAPSQPIPTTAQAPVAPPPPPYELPNKDGPLGPWESCITGTPPFDDVSHVVADFLFMKVVKNEDMGEIMSRNVQFEIEAKMGTLISKDTNERVSLPVLTECVLVDNGRVAFQSNMSEAQHKAFNDYLNLLVVETHPEAPRFDKDGRPKPPRVPIMYKHRRETDKFFELPPSMRARLPACVQHRIPAKHSVKVRVTYDQTTGKVIAMIVKARVADLDLYIPTCAFDCRISVNLEMDWDGSLEELEREAVSHDASPDRRKDRLSYTQSHYQIDLTQVTHAVAGLHNAHRIEKEHEIEIEVSAATVIKQGLLAERGQEHQYAELVEGLVNNVRHLARKARTFRD